MGAMMAEMNQLYFGDNLEVLRRYLKDESVDLIYLDPPFNSNADYNVLFAERDGAKSASQIKAFLDTWHWDESAERAYNEFIVSAPYGASKALEAFRTLLGRNDLSAYLVMMAPRLVELHRVLKPTGSIYLHCDPTASHYLKLLMDAVFGKENFRNEIIWKRSHAHNSAKRYGCNHDVIFFYSKTPRMAWYPVYQRHDPMYIEKHYRHVDSEGRRYKHENPTGAGLRSGITGQPWRGIDPSAKGRHWAKTHDEMERLDKRGLIYWPNKEKSWPYIKTYLDENKGVPAQDLWTDVDPINMMAQERLGYPTQKPEALLERIIKASSNEGDVVLDPFCGCGTAIAVAQRLSRRWIGIDITHLAIGLIKTRLRDAYGADVVKSYQLIGEPTALPDAETLAKQDRYQFQYWALGLVGARPAQSEQKKGADKGVDGRLLFHDEHESGKVKQVIFSVKSGHLKNEHIRELPHVVERENAQIGVLITLEPPTKQMAADAVAAGFYTSPWNNKPYRKIQILTIEDLLNGKQVDLPPTQDHRTFKKAPKAKLKGKYKDQSLFGQEEDEDD